MGSHAGEEISESFDKLCPYNRMQLFENAQTRLCCMTSYLAWVEYLILTSPVQTMNRNSGTTLEKDHSNEDQLYGKCRSWVVLSVQAAIILP